MNEFGWPVLSVMEERCKHCGVPADEFPHQEVDGEVGPAGHVFERIPFPEIDDAAVEVGGELIPERGGRGYDRLVATATYRGDRPDLAGVSVSVWKFREKMRFPGMASQLDFTGTPEEWAPVMRAAKVALARRVCPHVDTVVGAGVARIVADGALERDALPPATGFQLDLRVWCTDCGEPFVFVGDRLPVGMSPAYPTVTPAGTELSAPLRPLLYPEWWGRDRPGWGVRAR